MSKVVRGTDKDGNEIGVLVDRILWVKELEPGVTEIAIACGSYTHQVLVKEPVFLILNRME